MNQLAAVINQGIGFHLAGNLKAAEASYRKVLAADPRYPDAHNLLADLYNRQGDRTRALYHANMALSLAKHAQFFCTRASVFMEMGRNQEATADLRSALKLDPHSADAYANLCGAYRSLKELRKASESGRAAVRLNPGLAAGWINLGAVMQDLGDRDEALRCYGEALKLDPGNAMAWANLGKLRYQALDFLGACEALEAAGRYGHDGLEYRFVFAQSLLNVGRIEAAAMLLEEGLQKIADPKGLRALVVQDAFFQVLFKVCVYFARAVEQPDRAAALYRRCLDAYPDSAALWVNLGTVYFDSRRYGEAIQCYEGALKEHPDFAQAHSNIGVSYVVQGESRKAIESFEKALALQPDYAAALGWLLREKGQICDWDGFADLRERVRSLRFTGNTASISPFVALSVFEDPADLHYWARLASDELFATVVNCDPLPVRKRPKSRKKIRIGYYSHDFRDHPVAHLTARMFELHDRSRFDIYAYSYGPDDGSSVRRRIEKAAKHFVDVRNLSVVDAAQRISEDDLDILIDLTGNTQHTRSQIMALRPARLQAHWLGFIGTMGSHHYDYILADDFVVPAGSEGDFSEKILCLPGGMHIMDETRVIDGSRQTRAANGLPEDGVVFGCFCQSFKIQPETFAHWMRILRDVPGSVLWLASGPEGMEENLKKEADRQGVAAERLVVAPRCGMEEYLTRFTLMDLYLDTFPYTSGTVASDALLAGCPLLTVTGRTMVSRMAGSILRHADLPDLVCDSSDGYVEAAVRLGRNPGELSSVRQRLAAAKDGPASLFDTPAAVRGLETAVRSVIE